MVAAAKTVRIELNSLASSYEVRVEPGLLAKIGAQLRPMFGAAKAIVLTDDHIESLHLPAVKASLTSAGFEPIVAVLKAGEASKSLASLMPIYDRVLAAGIERGTPLLSLGGGVSTDVGGFVAATVLRGVPLVQVPTSLLAMVDASIGGKTGVDHAVGKNLIGAFYQPRAVWIDPEALKTLPAREFRGGLAECIKHELIRDAQGLAKLERDLDQILKLDIAALTDLIAHNVAIKAAVVQADPLEKGERAHLNFGHTFGHAIEAVSQFAYSHGESIALGMCAAAYASEKLGLIDAASRRRIGDLIARAGLPSGNLTLPVDRLVQAMQFDKKVKAGKIRLVLLDGIGRATLREDVPQALVCEALESLK